MKKFSIILMQLCFMTGICFSQKMIIDSSVFDKWDHIKFWRISNNGRYVTFAHGVGSGGGSCNWEVASLFTAGNPDKAAIALFTGDSSIARLDFSYNSAYVFAQLEKRIGIYNINTHVTDFIQNAKLVDQFAYNGQAAIAFYKNDSFCIRSVDNLKDSVWKGVRKHWINRQQSAIVLETAADLLWLDLKTASVKKMGITGKVNLACFDSTGNKLAYISETAGNNHLFYYNAPTGKADSINLLSLLGSDFTLTNKDVAFNADGTCIFFTVFVKDSIHGAAAQSTGLALWSYKAEDISTERERVHRELRRNKKSYLHAVINLSNEKAYCLGSTDDVTWTGAEGLPRRDYLLYSETAFDVDYWWHPDFYQSLYIVSVKTGERKCLVNHSRSKLSAVSLSPGQKFVTWFDAKTHEFSTYEIATGIRRTGNWSIPVPIYENAGEIMGRDIPYGILKWAEADSALYVYDKYDIWQADPMQVKKPVNVTHGYGRRNKIIFRFAYNEKSCLIKLTPEQLLVGLHEQNLDNGFYKLSKRANEDPQICAGGPFVYYFPQLFSGNGAIFPGGMVPEKAADTAVYLLNRSNEHEASNLFITGDFKQVLQVSHINPEKDYNWYTTALVKFQLPNGSRSQGILYKPENLDTSKKYPLIFDYYEKRSPELHKYIGPEWSGSRINIPAYVSDGYLVFVPDMQYTVGNPGEGVLNTVTAAVHELSHLSYVDISRLGLQGHSFGGFETNYLITHSTLFAAACEASGQSDFVSGYNSMYQRGTGADILSRQDQYERKQSNIGASMWERPALYIKNSPVFMADKISTPLLILHNREDMSVPFAQAVELFYSMRRNNKKVWMLEYEGEGHGVGKIENRRDYTIRMKQFFDHYLKKLPPPRWMTAGAEQLDRLNDFRLDSSGIIP
ncbi:alpha/beta hydrolase family protein [Deminuibacter soli]|nr:prolyl oligopeptidase family serine peptidase [Deminuibacter soli]